MSPSCCLTKHTCLAERSRAMRLNGPYGWGIRCMDCIEGAARQMDGFQPEPDVEPIPLRNTGKPPAPPPTCSTCGKPCTRGCKMCKHCWGLSRRVNHDKCSFPGCRWLARRGGKCQSHYFAAKKEAQAEYRKKSHAIAVKRMSGPKDRIVEGAT